MKFHKDNTDNLLTQEMIEARKRQEENQKKSNEAYKKIAAKIAIKQKKIKKRTDAYPGIADQLDMLWHDIDNGNISANVASGTWYTKIKAIKESNPL